MRAYPAIGLALLAASGCASVDGYTLKPGDATSAEVERVMGAPAETRKVGAETLLYYPRQPFAGKTYVARIGADGRLVALEQRLTYANVDNIVPNLTTAAQVRDLLGPPWMTSHYAATSRTVWTWAMYPGDSRAGVELDVQMSPDGVVREVYKLDTLRASY